MYKETPIFVFVGERRSPTAIKIGASWQSCQSEKPVLSARKLFRALEFCGLDPRDQIIINLWTDGGEIDFGVIERLLLFVQENTPIIGMGNCVHKVLESREILHLEIPHPAARGLYANPEYYCQRVADILKPVINARR